MLIPGRPAYDQVNVCLPVKPATHKSYFCRMLFPFLRFWIGNAMRAWFRKVYVSFEEPLPKDAPIIFACTHPNSAIDYLFVPLIIQRPVYVLVRGDVFHKKWLNTLFRSIWMLPVYRIRDGFSNLSRNADSFKECFSVFDSNGSVLIFSEGVCVQEKTLQPLKKGTARLAIDYMAQHGRDIYVVPVANNYTRFRQFRNSVMCNFGKPIKASDYKALFDQNPNRAYQKLTDDIAASLERNFIQVKPNNEEGWTEKALQALRLNRFENRTGWLIHDRAVYEEERRLATYLNEAGDDVLPADWKYAFTTNDVSHCNEGILRVNDRSVFFIAQLWLLSPVMALTCLPHVLPYAAARWLIKNKIRDHIFHTTVMVLGSLVIYMALWFGLLILSTAIWGWTGVLVSAGVLALSFIGIELVDEYRFGWYNRKHIRHRAAYKQLYQEIRRLASAPQLREVQHAD